ncbi:PKD domain-containing protein [Ekhidna sp.]|uniref:PKD domain-containing protein n=1 Tax=Ekhidna sp. TaxID=2608089 RepID=UPI003B506262
MRQLALLLFLLSSFVSTGQTISFGDLITGELTSVGQINSYSFSANAGDVIYIAAKGFGVAPRVEVFEPGGDEIGEVSSGASYESGRVTIQTTGTHTLTFEDTFGDQTGTYNIGFERINPATNAISKQFGDLIEGEITSAAQVDLYTFTATAGEAIYIAAKGFDVAVSARVYDSNGDFVGSVSSGATYESGRIYIETSGTHTLVFEETFLENTGLYNIGLEKIASAVNATPKNFGDLISGEITSPAQVDLYTFTASAGEAIYISAKGFDVAVSARVYDSNGDFVGSVSSGATYESGRIYIETSGTHTLVFEETFLENTGLYNIGLEKIASAVNAAPKNFGDLISGEITSPAQVDLYTFTASAGEAIYISAKGFDVAVSARVYDSNGDFVGSVSSGATYESGRIYIETTGTHTLVFEETFLENTGLYNLGLEKIASPENAIPKNFGDLTNGTITTSAQVDLYTFYAEVDEVIYLAVKGIGGVAPRARVYDEVGDFVGSVSSGASYESGSLTISTTGFHTIVFEETFLENTGTYNLALEKVFPVIKAEQISLNQVISRPLDQQTQVDLYTFEATAGDAIYLSVNCFEGVSPRARIYDPTGASVGSTSSGASSTSRIFNLEGTGRYVIVFEDTFLEDVGEYCMGLALICNGPDCDETAPISSEFGACKTQAMPGDDINFLSLSTNVSSRSWSFDGGDPISSTSQNPSITYNNAGVFDVSQTVSSGADNDTQTKEDYIIISSETPLVALFESDSSSIVQGDTIQFTDLSTGNITGWSWEFAGGTPATSTDQNPMVSYSTIGVYDVALTVSNSTSEDSKTIVAYVIVSEAEDPPLNANFTVDTDSVSRGESVQFTDASTGEVTSWNWTFEGGVPATSTDQNPVVLYNNQGIYDVTLVVGDGVETDEQFAADFIEVTTGPLPDLVFTGVSMDPNSLFSGNDVTTSVSVTNVGQANVVGEISVTYYLSEDNTLDQTDIGLLVNSVNDLQVGESKSLETVVNVPIDTESGNYVIIFEIDASNVIEESNEDNNKENLNVEILDRAPVLASPIADLDLEQGFTTETIDLSTVFEDPDQDQLTFTAISSDNAVVTIDISGSSLILIEQGPGLSNISVTADDNEDGSVSDEFLLTVNATGNNKPTVANPIDDLELFVGFISESIDLNDVFADEDGDNLALTIEEVDGTSVNPTLDGTLLTLDELDVGITTITIRANDGNGGLASETFVVEVISNLAPIVDNPISDIIGNEGFVSETISLASVFSDPDGDDLTYSAISDNEEIVTVSISGTNLIVVEQGIGEATITVTADDGNGGTVSDEFAFTVNDVNEAPVLENPISDLAFEPGFGTAIIELDTVFSDPDGDILSFTVTSSDENVVTASISNSSIILTEIGTGTADITVIADDGREGTAEDSFTVINAGNNPPEISNPITDQVLSQGFVTTSLNFEGVFSDPDEDELSYSVESLTDGIVSVTMSGNNIVFIEQGLGETLITLTADDGRNGIAIDTFNVSVVENTIPVVVNAIEDQTFDDGFESISFDLSDVFSDADGDALSYSATSSDETVVLANSSGTTLIIEEEGLGESSITVIADDGKGGIATNIFIVTVVEGALGVNGHSDFIYPTIASGIINISSEKRIVKSTISNLNGSVVNVFRHEKILKIDNLVSGTYIITVDFEDGSTSQMKAIIRN